MNKNLIRIRLLGVAAVLLTTCALSASAADLQRVVQCLEERERSQDPVWYKYTLKTYISATYREGLGKARRMPDRDLRDLKDLQFENTVEYARKRSLRFQKVSGPMASGKLMALIGRPSPSIFIFDGQKVISYDSPKYVLVSSQRGETMLPVYRPSEVSSEQALLRSLRLLAKGENYDLIDFKDDERVDGERLCRIEYRAKKTKWRSLVYLYPRLSYAVKSYEVIVPDRGTIWKAHKCAYREIDGVAYLQSATFTEYGGKLKEPKVRIPMKEVNYEAQSIETDIRKFPDFRSEAKIDSNAMYNDVDLKSTTTSPEQIQGVLDTIAGLSKISNEPLPFPWRQWLYGMLVGLAAAGLLALAIILVRRWRRQPVA